jgi:cytoskeletal protein RodZ
LFTGLLRGDSAARVSFYAGLFNIGVLSQNDIREMENLNPVDGGDIYYVPLNMRASDEKPEDEPTPQPPTDEDDDAEDAEMTAKLARTHTEIVAASLMPCVSKEAKAVERAAEKFATDAAAFNLWCDKFYTEHVAYIEQQVTPGIRSLVTLSGLGSASIATTYAIEHANASREQIEAAYAANAITSLCESWTCSRAAEGALKIVNTIIGDNR